MIQSLHKQMISDIKTKLKQNLKSKRLDHVLSVEKTSRVIGEQYKLDHEKLTIAALLHDIAKGYSINTLMDYCRQKNISISTLENNNHGLLHAKVSRLIAEKTFQISDPEILNAISSHTTGRIAMSPYEEIIFVADYCEPNRKLRNKQQIFETALHDLSKAVFWVVSEKIIYVIEDKNLLHPQSIEVYNHYQQLILHTF